MEKPKRQRSDFRRCMVGCENDPLDTNKRFFKLPMDPNRRAAWLEMMRLPDVGLSQGIQYVCSRHFASCYIYASGRGLTKNAVPTLNFPHSLPEAESEEATPTAPAETDSQDTADMQFNADEPTTSTHTPGTASDVNTQTTPAVTSSQDILQLNADEPTISTHTHVLARKRELEQDYYLPEYQHPMKLLKVKEEVESLTVFVEEHVEDPQVQLDAPIQEVKLEKKEKSNKLYSTEYLLLALALYFKSPLSYRVLRKSFNLPNVGVLYRLCIPKTTELSQQVLTALKIKADMMTSAEKQCVVCVGTMSLNPTVQYDVKSDRIAGFHEVDGVQMLEPARTLLVIMVRGLFHKWKQAIAYAFLSNFHNCDHVKLFIDEIIVRMFGIGLQVRVLMSDRDTDFVTGGNMRQVCSKNPFTIVNNLKIYYMYDPPCLIKYIRDHMLTHNYIFYSGLVAKWQHIVECYQHDHKKQFLRLAPHLSFSHIMPDQDALEDLNVASEVFSRTTAAAVGAYIDLKSLKPNAKDTVQWIATMCKLKDMLNFSVSNPHEEKNNVFCGQTEQVDFLVGMLALFMTLHSVPAESTDAKSDESPKPSKPPLVEYFRITINSILLLYGNLKTENCWFPVVGLTRDCLTDFFDKVRREHGPKPTTKQLVMCINKFPIFNIFQYFNKKRQPGDLETFVLHARQMPDKELYDLDPPAPFVDTCAGAYAEFSLIELPAEHRLDHLALYLLHKGYQQHKHCEQMESYAENYEVIKNDSLYISVRPSDNDISDATPREFVEFIEILDIKFKDYFKENRLTRSISGLLSFIRKVTFEMPCECFPIDYVKQLFLRCRLHIVLKYNNKMFKTLNNASFVINDL